MAAEVKNTVEISGELLQVVDFGKLMRQRAL